MDKFQVTFLKTIIERTYDEFDLYKIHFPELHSIKKDVILKLANDKRSSILDWISKLSYTLEDSLSSQVIEKTKNAIYELDRYESMIKEQHEFAKTPLSHFVLLLLHREYFKHLIEVTKPMIKGYVEFGRIKPTESPFQESPFQDSTIMRAYAAFMIFENKEKLEIIEHLESMGMLEVPRRFKRYQNEINDKTITIKSLSKALNYIDVEETMISSKTVINLKEIRKEKQFNFK